MAINILACAEGEFKSRTIVPNDANSPHMATRSMTPVELHIVAGDRRVEPSYGSARLVVPKAFLRGKPNWQGKLNELGEITIEAALPDLRPSSTFGEDLFEKMLVTHKQILADNLQDFKSSYHLAFFRDWLTIRARYGHCYGVSKSVPDELAKWGKKVHTYANPLFEKIDLGQPAGSLRSMYVPRHQGRYKTFIECPDWGGEMRRCRGITDYDAVVAFEFYFSISRLNEYRDIEEKSRKLLGSFIQSSEYTSAMPMQCRQHVGRKSVAPSAE